MVITFTDFMAGEMENVSMPIERAYSSSYSMESNTFPLSVIIWDIHSQSVFSDFHQYELVANQIKYQKFELKIKKDENRTWLQMLVIGVFFRILATFIT